MYNFVELHEIINIVLKRWWLLLLALLVGGGIGYGITQQQTPVYAAKTTLFVGRSIRANDLDRNAIQTSQELAITYAEIVRRQPVIQGTIDSLQLSTTWQSLRSRIKVGQVAETQLIEITAEAASPQEAELIAAEVARQVILLSPSAGGAQANEETFQFVQERLLNLQEGINGAQLELQNAQLTLAELDPNSIEAGALRVKIEGLENRLLDWDNLYARLLNFVSDMQATNQLSVIEPAQALTSPVRPRPTLNIAVGIFGMLALALFVIFLLEYFNDTYKDSEDFGRHTGLNVLGVVRQVAGKSAMDRLISKQDAYSYTFASEDYRLVYSKLHFAIQQLPQKIIMVTSVSSGDGKSLATANLGIAMAEAGLNVVIVDANLRRPSQHEIFELTNANGLIEVLHAPRQQLDVYLKNTSILNLRVLTAGTLPLNSAGMLGSAQMKDLLHRLAEEVDIVLCDSPEATGVADAAILAHQVAAVLLVLRKDRMYRSLIKEALKNLEQVGANFVGVLVNHPSSGIGVRPNKSKPSSPFRLALQSPQNVEAGSD